MGALRRLLTDPLGDLLLIGIAVGLLADAFWQGVRAATDADLAGSGLKGLVERASWILSGITDLGLAIATIKLITGVPQRTAEAQAKDWSAFFMTTAPGRWLVGFTALIIVVVGIVMLYRAWRGDIDRWLDVTQMTGFARAATAGLGRLGLFARGVIYGLVGVFLLLAAIEGDPWRVRALGGTFRAIRYETYGAPMLAVLAIGFIANGLVELICARYRRIRV